MTPTDNDGLDPKIVHVLTIVGLIAGPATLVAIIGSQLGWSTQRIAEISFALTLASLALLLRRPINRWVPAFLLVALIPLLWLMIPRGVVDDCFEEARRARKPYAIAAITYHIRVERGADPTRITQSRRTTYALQSTRAISEQEEVFTEHYDTHHKEQNGNNIAPIFWNGTEEEKHDPSHPEWYTIKLELAANERRTITTGADFILPFPFQNRASLADEAELGSLEDDMAYKNSDNDVICEIVFLVESATLPLEVGAARAGRHGGTSVTSKVDGRTNKAGKSLTVRWKNLMPQETVWLRYNFSPTPDTPLQ